MSDSSSLSSAPPPPTYRELAAEQNVSVSTAYRRSKGQAAPRGIHVHRALSVIQEAELINKINQYADRGTMLTPGHITQLAEALCGHHLGGNWTSRFIKRHSTRITSKFWKYQEVQRLKADSPETRQAFYALVSHWNS